MKAHRILHGDSRELLARMKLDYFDAIVTDPPYELGFMSKKWDKRGISFDPTWWAECLRVLKPGGHMVAFGGTRTWHRIAVAIEDAGFEYRDTLMWVYGQGFPKSLDVSKAIDKVDVVEERLVRARRSQAWFRKRLTPQQVNDATGSMMGHHITTHPTQPFVPTPAMLDCLRPLIEAVPNWLEGLVRERAVESANFAARAVVGRRAGSTNPGFAGEVFGGSDPTEWNVTLSHTPEAKQWHGWGTALRPSWEPIILARKPLDGTVAKNVLKYGTGGLNIDATRTAGVPRSTGTHNPAARSGSGVAYTGSDGQRQIKYDAHKPTGRWPANVILGCACEDEREHDVDCSVRMLDEQSGIEKAGGASRFFYVAKAGRLERELGLLDVPLAPSPAVELRGADSKALNSPRAGTGRGAAGMGIHNTHPT